MLARNVVSRPIAVSVPANRTVGVFISQPARKRGQPTVCVVVACANSRCDNRLRISGNVMILPLMPSPQTEPLPNRYG